MMAAKADSCVGRQPWRWIALLVLAFGIQIGPLWYATPDSVCYLSIARSLSRDHTASNLGSSHLYYSIGYPLLICPAFLFDERPFLILSLMHFFWVIVLIRGVYCWARRCLPEAAFWITSLTMINASMWNLYRRPLSEMPFMAILMLIVNLSEKTWISETVRRRIGWTVCVALLITLLTLIRPVGIMTATGFGLAAARSAMLGRIRWTRALVTTLAVGVPATTALVATIYQDRLNSDSSGKTTYVRQIVDHDASPAEQIVEGVRTRIIETGRLIMPGMYKSYNERGSWLNVNMAVYLPMCALICLGWFRLNSRTNDVLVSTLPGYMLVYIIWPYEQSTRFVVPMLPVWLGSLWLVFGRLEPNYRRILYSFTLGAHFAVALGYWLFDEMKIAREINREWNVAQTISEPIREKWRPVLVSERTKDFRYLLEYQLDRPIWVVGDNDPIPAECEFGWLVFLKEDEVPEGFVLHSEFGRYLLFTRLEMETPIHPPAPRRRTSVP